MVHGWVVAAVRSRSAAVAVRLLRQGHVTELGVEGVRLGVQVIGWLLLRRGRDWLLWGFPLLWDPASGGGGGGRVINYGAAVGVDERLACVWVDQNAARRYP